MIWSPPTSHTLLCASLVFPCLTELWPPLFHGQANTAPPSGLSDFLFPIRKFFLLVFTQEANYSGFAPMLRVCLLQSIPTHFILSSSYFFPLWNNHFLFPCQSFVSSLGFKVHDSKALSLVFTDTFLALRRFSVNIF